MKPSKFKELRERLKLSQAELGRELGLEGKNIDVTIRKIETGIEGPNKRIVNHLDLLILKDKIFNYAINLNEYKEIEGEHSISIDSVVNNTTIRLMRMVASSFNCWLCL